MKILNQKINPFLAMVLIFMVAFACALLILGSLNQPSGINIGTQAASIEE